MRKKVVFIQEIGSFLLDLKKLRKNSNCRIFCACETVCAYLSHPLLVEIFNTQWSHDKMFIDQVWLSWMGKYLALDYEAWTTWSVHHDLELNRYIVRYLRKFNTQYHRELFVTGFFLCIIKLRLLVLWVISYKPQSNLFSCCDQGTLALNEGSTD